MLSIEQTIVSQSDTNRSFAVAAKSHPLDRETFLEARALWKEMARQKKTSASAHVVWNVLRGLPADRGFTPLTNKRCIESGHDPMAGFKGALGDADSLGTSAWEPFEPLLKKTGASVKNWRWVGDGNVLFTAFRTARNKA